MKFNYYLPSNLIFGRGRVAELGSVTAKYGKKALIVTGTGSTKRSGLLDRAVALLKDAGVASVVFDKATPNPLTTTVMEGAALAKSEDCDVIVGLGGGSIMDCSKGVALMAKNDGDVSEYVNKTRTGTEALPLVLVPTTCGTGSEGNWYAVLSNPENGDKRSLVGLSIVAKASIVDSEVMETMPSGVLASVGFDALCHLIEAYTSKTAQPMTDYMALAGIELIGRNLPVVYHGNGDADAWDALAWASTLGGMAIHLAGCTLAHGMEHPASGLRNITHGKGLAALTPAIIDRSWQSAPERYAAISRLLGGTGAEDCADTVRKFLDSIDLHVTLGQQGIKDEDVPWMVDNMYRVSAATVGNHLVQFTKEEYAEIYRASL